MNLRKEIIVGIALILIVLVLYSLIESWQTNIEQTNMQEFIIEDLQNKHPDADIIEIISTEKIFTEVGKSYYFIKAKVTIGINTPCPVRIHYYYNFPEQNFVTQPPEYITEDCAVCEVDPCTLTFEEEAIIASHTLEGTEEIHEYIEDNEDAYPTVNKVGEDWKVKWSSPSSTSEYEVLLSPHGEVLDIERIEYDTE